MIVSALSSVWSDGGQAELLDLMILHTPACQLPGTDHIP